MPALSSCGPPRTSALSSKPRRATASKAGREGSGTLASEILANEINPGVFMSVGKKNIKRLWPANRSKFVIQLATDPLVVAYNPQSKFAPEFNAIADHKASFASLFTLLSSPGIRSGAPTRTQTRRASTSS